MAWNGAFYGGVYTLGFDFLTTASMNLVMLSNTGTIATTNARFGDGQTHSLLNGNSDGVQLLVNLPRMIKGIAVFPTSLPASGFESLFIWQDATAGSIQLQLMVGSLGQLQFFLANGTTAVGSASANGVIAANRYAYIQTDVTIGSGTSGSVKCYVDTSGSSPVISNTGVNSQSTANAYFNQFKWLGVSPGAITYFDDLYMLDMTGAAPLNAILGPVHIHWDPANSDQSPNQFSTNPSQTTGNHYKNIDPVTTPSGTAYNFDSNPGDEELYGLPAITAAKVFVINEWMYVELDAAGPRTVSPVLVSGGVSQIGPAFTPATSWQYAYQPSVTDPNTGNPWSSGTVAAAGSADLGITVVT